jgi:3-hydroxybutyryl-CoA dehydrogenase
MKVEDIKNICNLGTGSMGFGTALTFAKAGYKVRMFGRSDASIERGFKSINAALATYLENGLVAKADIPVIVGRIKGVTTLEAATEGADFVIESVAEDLNVKREVYAKIDKLCPAHTIFATDTSGLSPTAIAEAVARKDKFVVAHFWNPAHLLPLVEVVPGKHTAQETVDLTVKLMEVIGKKPIPLKREALGFVGNRMQYALLREAMYIVETGIASKEAVDATIKYSIGRRLGVTGPLETADIGGLDIFYNISEYMMPDLCDSHKVSRILKDPVDRGNYGAKTGTGIYDWTPEGLAKIRKMREKVLIEWLQKDKDYVF